MKPMRAMVVGTGALGRHHARILSGLPAVSLVAVAEPNESAGRAVAEAHGAQWFADSRDAADQVDLAVVAAPTVAHHRLAFDLLSAGVDVFVEKPLTHRADQARDLVELAESAGRILQVGHVERYNPAFVAARNSICDPRYIRSERVSPYSFRSTDIGVIFDVMIHDIDLILSLVAEPVDSIEAFGISIMGRHEDVVQARLRFANGCIADLTASRVAPVSRRTMQAWSSAGCVQIDFATREATVYRPTPTLLFGTPPVDRARQPGADIEQLKADVFGTFIEIDQPLAVSRDQLTEELLAFVDAVRSRTPPAVSGEQGLAAVEIAERIREAVGGHQWDATAQGRIGPFLATAVSRQKMAG